MQKEILELLPTHIDTSIICSWSDCSKFRSDPVYKVSATRRPLTLVSYRCLNRVKHIPLQDPSLTVVAYKFLPAGPNLPIMAIVKSRLSYVGKTCALIALTGIISQILNLKSVECLSLVEEVQNSYRQRDSFQYCGSKLASAIKAFCDNHASLQGLYAGGGHGPKILEPDRSRNPYFHSHNRENTLQNKHHSVFNRVTRSVNDECCLKPCNSSQLLKYCATKDSYEDDVSTELSTSAPQTPSVFSDDDWTIEDEDSVTLNDLPFVPLLIDLLWANDYSPPAHPAPSISPPKSVTFWRFTPQVDNNRRTKTPHSTRLIPRDTYQNQHYPKLLPKPNNVARYRPLTSDETRRDLYSSEEHGQEIPYSSPERLMHAKPMESQAVQIEDDWPTHSFAIPSGTNSDWV